MSLSSANPWSQLESDLPVQKYVVSSPQCDAKDQHLHLPSYCRLGATIRPSLALLLLLVLFWLCFCVGHHVSLCLQEESFCDSRILDTKLTRMPLKRAFPPELQAPCDKANID